MANCSTVRELFHEKGAQNNGEKNKVKLFFQKKIVPRRKIVPQPGRARYVPRPPNCSTKLFHAEKLFHALNKKRLKKIKKVLLSVKHESLSVL